MSIGTLIGVLRSCVGVLSWVSPTTAHKVFGLSPPTTETAVMTRLFASREVVLGVSLLLLSTSSSSLSPSQLALRSFLLQAGVVVDTMDFITYLVARHVHKGISNYAMISGGWGAALFASMGSWELFNASH